MFKVKFLGETAEDAGGVKKEFFLLLMKELMGTSYGMFKQYEESCPIWFSENSLEDSSMFMLIGTICGLAIYNFTLIDLPFPLALYKKLLSEKITLNDLRDLSPVMARSMEIMQNYNELDFQETFNLHFAITRESFGITKSVNLKPLGDTIPVTLENKYIVYFFFVYC